jgi:hypothetical protein
MYVVKPIYPTQRFHQASGRKKPGGIQMMHINGGINIVQCKYDINLWAEFKQFE